MTNKYQAALDKIKYWTNIIIDNEYTRERFDTLQELIDNYSKIQQFDKDGLVIDGMSYAQLEKALDKACEKLKKYDVLFPNVLRTNMSKEQWKEWLLKNED